MSTANHTHMPSPQRDGGHRMGPAMPPLRRTEFLRMATHRSTTHQRGVSLIVVLLLLIIVSMLGIASMQIAMMGERGARNDRDLQLAWQGAEAALGDAEIDLHGPNPASASRTSLILANPSIPASGCTTTGTWRGLCAAQTIGQTKPTWLLVDFSDTGNSAPSVAFGTYTGRNLDNAGGTIKGVQPAQAPRYIVEDISSSDGANPGRMVGSAYASAAAAGTQGSAGHLFRITAMGFGPRTDIQAVLQTIYRN